MSNIKKRWANVPKPLRVTGYIIFGLCCAAAMGIVFGLAIMLLWNWLMPELFGLKEITYWQGIGIFILAKFIFGFGMGGGDNSKSNKADSKSSNGSWTDYDRWWEKEGKKAFEDYTVKKEGGNCNE